mmetsp:Transcript_47277/g.124727  ORF Transcript_47277/g.124727 Transcript_47277/m.124727 type:complete len:201 (+) Transcript_47277:1934-2536(+)
MAQASSFQIAEGAAVQHDPEVLAARWRAGKGLAAWFPNPCTDANQHRHDGVGGPQRCPLRDEAGCLGEMVQQPARRAVRCVHWAQEAPRLGQQLAHRGGLHLCKVLPAVHGGEVRAEPGLVQLVRHDGVPRGLHEIHATTRPDVARGQEAGQLLRDVDTLRHDCLQQLWLRKEVLLLVLGLFPLLALIGPLADHHVDSDH